MNSAYPEGNTSDTDDLKSPSAQAEPSGSPWRGRVAIAIAAVLWSTSGFFAKAPWFEGWSPELRGIQLAFWRSLFAGIALAPFVRRPRWHPYLPLNCLAFALMLWTFMSAMVHGPAANAIWLQYLAPAWVLLVGVLFLRERISSADGLMFVCCLGGVLLILTMELRSGSPLYATIMGLVSSIMFATVILLMRTMRDQDPAWIITLNQFATALILLPWVWSQPLDQVAPGAYLALALFGIFQLSLPYIIFCNALRSVSGPEASLLTLIEPVVLPLWVWLAWSHHPSYESPQWWTLAGGGLILSGLLIRYLPMLLRNRLN